MRAVGGRSHLDFHPSPLRAVRPVYQDVVEIERQRVGSDGLTAGKDEAEPEDAAADFCHY